jgi:hypothetical protein
MASDKGAIKLPDKGVCVETFADHPLIGGDLFLTDCAMPTVDTLIKRRQ